MTNYQRLLPGQRTPLDAVIVTVRRGMGRTVADVAAVEQIADFPMPVPQALVEAAEMQDRLHLERILIVLEDEKLWLAAWGTLT